MGIATSQTIGKYYELYHGIDVTFTKEVIRATGLVAQQVYLKCGGGTWPCVIYATSFETAKIIINTKTGIMDKLKEANNLVSLRFSFRNSDKADPIPFSVQGRVSGMTPYGGSPDIGMITIAYTQRPSDDLIEIIGRLLDANMNSAKRREDRVVMTVDVMRKIGVANKETILYIQGVPRRCILRDLSFSGAKIIMVGVAKFLINREVALCLEFEEPRETMMIKGRTIRSEEVEGRKDLLALGLIFDEQNIPMTYKMRINDFLSMVRADSRVDQTQKTDAK